jgi:hypothetical protein
MAEAIETVEKKLKCPDCEEETTLLLEETTSHITIMKAENGKWNNVKPVNEYDDEVNPSQAIICEKCGYEFATSQDPLMTSDEFDELESHILKGTLTQDILDEVY